VSTVKKDQHQVGTKDMNAFNPPHPLGAFFLRANHVISQKWSRCSVPRVRTNLKWWQSFSYFLCDRDCFAWSFPNHIYQQRYCQKYVVEIFCNTFEQNRKEKLKTSFSASSKALVPQTNLSNSAIIKVDIVQIMTLTESKLSRLWQLELQPT